jgi:Bifunctional DNA primase/polymerase, N-terminal/Primase C terminal 1 (PriCT-1)
MAVEDRRQLLEQHARFYARHGFAVVFTRGLEGDLAKRVTDPGWEKTPPLPDSNGGDYAAGLIGTRALTRNIGITLRSSNLIGVEADSPELIDRVHELELPATLTEQTRGPERRHWYFRPPANLNGALEVVSFRFEGDTVVPATNNYYVCAPSIHPVTGGVYTIRDDGLELETIPELPLGKLVELMTLAGRTLHGRKTGKPRAARVAGTVPVGRRHETLTSLAGTMNRRGMSADAIEAALQVEDATLFDEPVGERDVRAIAESVTGRYEPVQPVEVLSGFEKTDVGNGQLFAAAQQGRLRYV